MKGFGGVAVLATALALPAAGAEQDFRWSGRIATDRAIEIKGINGGIEASGSARSEAEVIALKRGRKSDPSEVKIDGITIDLPEGAGA